MQVKIYDLYCINRPEVHTLSCGAAKPSDFDEHIAALQHYDNIEAVIDPIERSLRSEMETVLGSDWCKHWTKGLPNYLDVPGQVNITEILRLWTYAKSLDKYDMRYTNNFFISMASNI